MKLTIKPNHFRRYKDIVYLLVKYGQADVVTGAGLDEIVWGPDKGSLESHAREECNESGCSGAALAADLSKLGPTFIKLGQLLASRPDLLPLSFLDALSHLGEHIEPLAFSEVEKIIFGEIGMSVDEAFKSFNRIPISAGIFSQTHSAALPDGKSVIVKVQRPTVAEQVHDDLDAIEEIAEFYDEHVKAGLKVDFHGIFEEFRKIILAELDFRQEAHNLRALQENLKQLDRIVIPQPFDRYSTARMLTMTLIAGKKITEGGPEGLLSVERAKLAEQVFYAYLQQILVDGFVDAEPSPENVLLTPSGKAALLDIGVVVRITPTAQEKLLQMLLAIGEGRAERAADLLLAAGVKLPNFNEAGFRRATEQMVLVHRDMTKEKLEFGKIFLGIAQASVQNGVLLPSELAMLGNALVNVERVSHTFDSRFDVHEFMRQSVVDIMRHHMMKTMSPGHVFQNVIEALELLEQLPAKISKILDAIANNEVKITVQAIDENVLIAGFQKIANRIAIALILAALIIGAAMFMHIQTQFTLWGYPGLAVLCFIFAAVCSFILVAEVLIGDIRWR